MTEEKFHETSLPRHAGRVRKSQISNERERKQTPI